MHLVLKTPLDGVERLKGFPYESSRPIEGPVPRIDIEGRDPGGLRRERCRVDSETGEHPLRSGPQRAAPIAIRHRRRRNDALSDQDACAGARGSARFPAPRSAGSSPCATQAY